ncbi:hypothetical protein JCM11641_001695 [Rhodosporidiobolus odoratus]
MHLPLALVASGALLSGFASAAPLPQQGASSSCNNNVDGINVGVGVNIGNGIKVKQGSQGVCPGGWAPSLLQVDLCIQIGGKDHQEEQQQFKGGNHVKTAKTTTKAVHVGTAPPRVKAAKTTTTSSCKEHKATTTTSHKKHKTTTTAARSTPTYDQNGKKKCPPGHRLGSGSLIDLCVDIDTDPLFVGGGIKIGSGPAKTTTTTTTSHRGGVKAAHTNKPYTDKDGKKRCPDGQTSGSGSLLDLCVDIDTDPLYIGAGIKIGSRPSASSTTTSSRGRVSTPTPTQKNQNKNVNKGNGDGDLPPCQENDPLALLDLCVQVGDLLGAKVKVGGSPSSTSSPSNDNEDYGNFNGRNGIKIGRHSSTTTSARPRQTSQRNPTNNNNKNKSNGNDNGDDLPACNGNDDPKAALNACVKVGDVAGVGATVLGEDGTKVKAKVGDATIADVSLGGNNDNKNKKNDDDSNGLLNVKVGGLLDAKVLAASPTTSSASHGPTVHQTSPIRVADGNNNNNKAASPAAPLVSAAVKVGSGPSSSDGGKKNCPVGQILHLGICVEAKVDVPGVVKASAAATVAV